MHSWGDQWFEEYGNDLHLAISRIQRICRKALIPMHGKEKYGTFRDELLGLWDGSLHGICYPGYVYIQFNRILYNIDNRFITKVTTAIGLKFLVRQIQAVVYNYAFQSTIKKYPHLEIELTVMVDGYNMIKPGIFGPVDGSFIHACNWTSSDDEKEKEPEWNLND